MRDTTCAPKPPTNSTTGHQMSRQGLTQNDQKCQFWAKLGCFWANNPNFYWRKQKFGTHITVKTLFALFFGRTLDEMCQKCQFWAKNRYSFRGSKSFGTNVTEKTPTHLVRIVFWSGVEPNEPKMPIFGQKSQFWAKFGRLRAKNPNFYGSK